MLGKAQGDGGESLGGANTHEGKVRRSRSVLPAHPLTRMKLVIAGIFGRSFPFPEVVSTCSLRRVELRTTDTEKPLKSRRSRVRAGPRKGRRGEAPRGVPRAGRSKTLKGKPHGCWAVDGPSSGASRDRGRKSSGADEQGANRREGTQTLGAKGAGEWNPRVNRTCCAGMCRRGRNPRSAVMLVAQQRKLLAR